MQRPVPTEGWQLISFCKHILQKFKPSNDPDTEQYRVRMRATQHLTDLEAGHELSYVDREWIKNRYWGDCRGEFQYSHNSPSEDRATTV